MPFSIFLLLPSNRITIGQRLRVRTKTFIGRLIGRR